MTTIYICVGTIFTLIKLLDILINLGQNRSSHGHTWSNVTFCHKSFEFDLVWLIFTKLEQLKLVSLPDWSFDSNFVLDWKWILVGGREEWVSNNGRCLHDNTVVKSHYYWKRCQLHGLQISWQSSPCMWGRTTWTWVSWITQYTTYLHQYFTFLKFSLLVYVIK